MTRMMMMKMMRKSEFYFFEKTKGRDFVEFEFNDLLF